MAFSLAMIILLGLLFNQLFTKMKLPGLLGMLVLGVLIGPYGLDWLDESILLISGDLRKIALIVILIRAGFGINRDTLNKIGIPALKLSCIPGIFEGLTVMLVGGYLLGISRVEAGMLGFILAAVSPAVIVPSMLSFIERGKGEEKGIPTLILAGASVDDVVAITIFSSFVGMYGGQNINFIRQLLNIPLSIVIGIALGAVLSILLLYIFNHFHIRNTKKVLMILASAIILTGLEDILNDTVPIAALLGVMVIGFVILEKKEALAKELSNKFNKIWVFAEIILFVLVGAQVNIYLAAETGWIGLVIIAIGLMARSFGVYLSLLGTNLSTKERGFCVVAYIPKATVQAAIGAVPLSIGAPAGEMILALAVLAIVVTAPIGAIAIKVTGERVLEEKL
ncbi:cation:proton antiporter [Clostridium formicaceticum]|uniref:Potassium transporter n=1 Tax=Clostridium formicaceticum TaxID=1497 RepID=A0AAC9RKY7_9CLOT|nr:cation:proton antiporter [Clostridium formicaceticum]AOY75845.1 potassium transporter [Clostridium formicaceticum]ARE86180.1 potassium/proton antiporter [Clostridium formicaceticum]